jgi:hypothetical protein
VLAGALKQAILLAKLALPDLDAQGTDGVVDNFGFIGTKENQVAVLGASAPEHFGNRFVMNVLDQGRLQTGPALGLVACTFGQIVDLDVSQALGTINLDKLAVGINLAARQATHLARSTRNAQTHDAPVLHVGGT